MREEEKKRQFYATWHGIDWSTQTLTLHNPGRGEDIFPPRDLVIASSLIIHNGQLYLRAFSNIPTKIPPDSADSQGQTPMCTGKDTCPESVQRIWRCQQSFRTADRHFYKIHCCVQRQTLSSKSIASFIKSVDVLNARVLAPGHVWLLTI